MVEYPAMIYKTNRNKTYVANCIVKNMIGFGKTEKDAINNLKASLKNIHKKSKINVKVIYGMSII